MYQKLRLLSCLICVMSLMYCTTTNNFRTGGSIVDNEDSRHKYTAWRLQKTTEFNAINVLLDESDALIEMNSFNAAADKLERVLRIKPNYAPAWSRLSWLALQMDAPKRSIQMAKRSNSFAFSSPELQSLNWSFIRQSSKVLNDDASYRRATQKIESLEVF